MEYNPNLMATGLAALIPMIVGFVYYHPKVMGGMWMDANGFKLETLKPPKPILYLAALGLSVLLSLFIQQNVTGPGQDTAPDGHSYHTFGHGLVHGLVLTIMLVIPIFGTMAIFEQKSMKWLGVNVGYWLVTVSLMAGLLSAWR
jgi:hypothetical protein